MYIRRAFTQFLDVQSEAEPLSVATIDWTLDWRWFCEPALPAAMPTTLPSERSLIDWPAWAKPRKPSRDSSVRR
jgi:hypothetical protein